MSASDLIEVQVESESGSVVPIRCRRIVSIAGRPYEQPVDSRELDATLNHLAGRIEAVERILAELIQGKE